ncbi:YggS family pyridoxal phosphate-dependent enzyme [Kiloniella laminariae]|uniref:YggS family pyridoxal phosphate-dependent enzyme n=1 Tax=Kiloniella laminariae TaxID=454162 RepID=UPI00035FD421|nr:YggS family pyridoxal phosphate-dependent enzyme [Kiloniella laminariae]
MVSIKENLNNIGKQVKAAQEASLMNKGPVTLVAVSKTNPAEAVLEAYEAGQRVFGENRVQEALAKFKPLKVEKPDIVLHLIGPLQTNKCSEAVALFDVIQTIDRIKLVDSLVKEMSKQDRFIPCYIQVNTGEESQKAGVMPADLKALLDHCRTVKLPVIGLMCIPPVDEEAALHFSFLYKLAEEYGLSRLSMGMTGDFETAIRFGATDVRVGSGIFGERDYSEQA